MNFYPGHMNKTTNDDLSTATAKAIAAALGVTPRAVNKRADREAWSYTEQAVRGGQQRTYIIADLPADVRDAVARRLLESAPALSTTAQNSAIAEPLKTLPVAVPSSTQLANWQRDIACARKALVDEVKRIGAVIGTDRAIGNVIQLAEKGELPEHLQRLVPVANAKRGSTGTRTLSRRSLYRWIAQADAGFSALAPAAPKNDALIPAWAPHLLALFQQPQKPSLAYCIEQLPAHLPQGLSAPSYHAARRFLEKMSKVDVQRGRMGPRELRSIRPYVKRDTSHMWPGECYTADGHTFDAEIAHPSHGRPFRPEITTVLDVATRRAVGWSVGLAESTWAVLDAQRNAIETGGIPALWYVDRGSGYRNATQQDEVVGFAARLGITITHSLPYNSQARGLMERSHKSIWVRAAKQLPTFMGAPMDREQKHNVFKITRHDIKEFGASRHLMAWRDFVAFCQAQVDAYNNRPHRSLPKVRDAESGKLRHSTPNEAWQAAVAEGWEAVTVSRDEAADLFRPYKICHVARGLVQLFSNSYFSAALEDFHGEKVHVGYDIHDASRVWVRDTAGRLICIAEFEANRRAYFPQSVIEQAAEKRAQGRIRRAEARIEEAQAELTPPSLIDQQTGLQLEPLVIDEPALPEHVIAFPAQAGRRPMFDSDAEKYRWLLEQGDDVTADDRSWIDWYRTTAEWVDLFGYGGRDEEVGMAARM